METIEEVLAWHSEVDRQIQTLNMIQSLCFKMYHFKSNLEMSTKTKNFLFEEFRTGALDGRLQKISVEESTATIDFDIHSYKVFLILNLTTKQMIY